MNRVEELDDLLNQLEDDLKIATNEIKELIEAKVFSKIVELVSSNSENSIVNSE